MSRTRTTMGDSAEATRKRTKKSSNTLTKADFVIPIANNKDSGDIEIPIITSEPTNPWAQLKIFEQSLTKMIENKFDEQDAKRRIELEETKRANKRQKADISFKYKSNKINYNFLEELKDCVDDAKDLSHTGPKKRLLECLDELEDRIVKRQKVIRLADKSPGGWTSVEEYTQDDLADDAVDDKKIREAEGRAMAKIKQQTKSCPQSRQ